MAKSASGRQPGRSAWPQHVLEIHFAADAGGVDLKITIARGDDIKAYGFAYDGVAVPMSQGEGHFTAPPRQKKLLEWVMVGEPRAAMKVTVTRVDTGEKVKERAASTIPASGAKGYDAFEIEVS